ncbi:MAG: SDR family oxidoreductase [Acidobacteriota bacterium]
MVAPIGTMLITGGSRGIGAATAVLAARRGYDVCFSYHRRVDDAEQVVEAIEAIGRRTLAVAADVASEAEVVTLWRRAIESFGTIDALINNAGVLDRQQRLDAITTDRLERLFGVNVFGSILCAREAVRHMSTRHGGAGGVIVNVSSVAARSGSPGEYVDYAASKGAIDTMTVGLAREVAAESIRVNGVRPGFVETEIHASGGEPDRVTRLSPRVPMQRGGRPEEIAEAILWLVSERSSYATGAILDVAGGL